MRLGNRIYRSGDRAEGFRGGSDAVGKPHLPVWGSRRLFFLKLTPMERFPNRTYWAWGYKNTARLQTSPAVFRGLLETDQLSIYFRALL